MTINVYLRIYKDFNYWLLDLNLLWNSIINDETDAMAN